MRAPPLAINRRIFVFFFGSFQPAAEGDDFFFFVSSLSQHTYIEIIIINRFNGRAHMCGWLRWGCAVRFYKVNMVELCRILSTVYAVNKMVLFFFWCGVCIMFAAMCRVLQNVCRLDLLRLLNIFYLYGRERWRLYWENINCVYIKNYWGNSTCVLCVCVYGGLVSNVIYWAHIKFPTLNILYTMLLIYAMSQGVSASGAKCQRSYMEALNTFQIFTRQFSI